MKYTTEPPTRIKSSMVTLYRENDDASLNTCKKPTHFRRLTWGLNFFHSILWARRKFGQIGWSTLYDFNTVDHAQAIERVRQYLNSSEERNEDVPYKTLQYLISDVLYGGHITDPRDLQTVRMLLNDFFNPSIMEEKYNFTSKEVYLLPPDGGLAIDSYLNQLPSQDDPEILGYSDNMKGFYNKLEALKFFETLAIVNSTPYALSRKDAITLISGMYSDLLKLTPALDIQRKLPSDPLQTEHKDFVHDGILGAILQQEVAILNELRYRIIQSLNLLKYTLEKDFVSLKMVQSMYNALTCGQVPKEWKAYESNLSLSNWLEDLKERYNFFQSWLENGTPNVLWIGAFTHPQAIFTCT
jgi:dynein heavy chain